MIDTIVVSWQNVLRMHENEPFLFDKFRGRHIASSQGKSQSLCPGEGKEIFERAVFFTSGQRATDLLMAYQGAPFLPPL